MKLANENTEDDKDEAFSAIMITPPRYPEGNYERSPDDDSASGDRPTFPRNINEFGVDVRRLTVQSYRNRRGEYRTIRRAGIRSTIEKRMHENLMPRVIFAHDIDEVNDVQKHSIDIEWGGFDDFMEHLEPLPYRRTITPRGSRFSRPFVPLFLRLEALERVASTPIVVTPTESNGTTSTQNIGIARAILTFLDENACETRLRIKALESASPSTLIQYDDLWMLYKPGQTIFERIDGPDTVCYMVDFPTLEMEPVGKTSTQSRMQLFLRCWTLEYDPQDDAFKKESMMIQVQPFQGGIEIAKLRYLPEKFVEDLGVVKALLIYRGRNFWDMNTKSRYRQLKTSSKQGQDWLSGLRVIVDAKAKSAMKEIRHSVPGRSGGGGLQQPAPRAFHGTGHDGFVDLSGPTMPIPMPIGSILPTERIPPPPPTESPRQVGYFEAETKPKNWFREYESIPASSEPDTLALMLCPRIVSAFSLRKKTWDSYNVRDLKPVQFVADTWKRLVLKTEYKDVVWAMVKSYLNHNTGFHDLVDGKGEGLVVLLHGPPGVGKTLTAECVAESFKKPLYMVTAGDLGTNPDTLEAKLSTIFDHAVAWDAILLLDEADIFLQDRDYDNLHRNALVSKYFNGIMFLTSNRVGAFDQAFQSRIHITIGMPEFDETLRRGVWKIFIQDLGRERRDGSPPLLSRDECKALGTEVTKSWASQPLNGRQIRNCIRSALALAENEGVSPNASHFNKVINLGNAFTKYMTQLQKAEAEEIAQIKGDRLAAMKDIMARESDL
ncbi:ATPase [Colletotrichum tamarilloi]|uniref:ATPase n=1 Tax=Colletotrichum tamarilloi TaxID=1209934 RepID=A0ABQ9R019_9PEZI|nr:ATPase [Colletotrichum tamarilloi]KAK1490795.1 ATPase [Colletotrichum tamarilloi]